jgi:hypothetical protein
MADEVVSKKPWQSKTILANTVIALAGVLASLGFLPSVHEFLQGHVEIVVSVIAGLGVLLRLVTHGKISIE